MSRFDIHPIPARGGGYVLDVQSDLLQDFSTPVVVPLLSPRIAPKPARALNPSFEMGGESHLMLTQFIAAVPARELGTSILSLHARSDDITRARDILLVGF